METTLESWLTRAHASHPNFAIHDDSFRAYLAERRDANVQHAADLYLACGCLLGVIAAVETFEQACIAQVPKSIAKIDRSPLFVAEIQQRLREKLIVGSPDQSPRISGYAGLGPLAAFVRVAAIREALMDKRATRPNEVEKLEEAAVAGDVTLDLVRREYRVPFQQALRESIESLERHERSALRFSYLDNLSIDQIAKVFGVHRATAARWITRAQTRVRELTHEALRQQLDLDESELESLVGDLLGDDPLSSGMLVSAA